MTLQINLGTKKEKRLMRHLKVEHPSVRGNIRVTPGNRKSINNMLMDVPDFEKQAKDFTKIKKILKGGRK
tara:strand:+ start:16235 stop:16444 length:210 start_codon:yes stop_codon:yes gene_type:complete